LFYPGYQLVLSDLGGGMGAWLLGCGVTAFFMGGGTLVTLVIGGVPFVDVLGWGLGTSLLNILFDLHL